MQIIDVWFLQYLWMFSNGKFACEEENVSAKLIVLKEQQNPSSVFLDSTKNQEQNWTISQIRVLVPPSKHPTGF